MSVGTSCFAIAGQVEVVLDAAGMRTARDTALGFIRAGGDHVTLGIAGRAGPAGLEAMAREVAEPIRQAAGRG